ncbi:hypothetical protein COY95_02555, partial [Candidatus Woesearchaeota archaeon CG_4_10_14_0_8_um_filter_47_5]
MTVTKGRVEETLKQRPVKIDIKDKRILTLLAEDSRMPISQIKKKVQLSRDAIDYRIKRLMEKGVLIRCFSVVNLKQFGYHKFHVFFLTDEREPEAEHKRFVDYLIGLPFVRNIIEYTDRWDYEIVMVAKDVIDFDNKMTQITNQFPNLIIEKDKMQ